MLRYDGWVLLISLEPYEAPHVSDLFDPHLLARMLDEGYVKSQTHPEHDLTILNYTNKTAFDRVWNDVTKACRGLVINSSGFVVSRPFPKFYNYGEHEEGSLSLDQEVYVTDKADGSLGISVPTSDGTIIATRGSFTSDQALWATQWLKNNFPDFEAVPYMTYLWEIIYPENRIVLDYGKEEKLLLLGMVDNETGQYFPGRTGLDEGIPIECLWYGESVDTFPHKTLGEALNAEPRKNAEGLVVYLKETDSLVKIKQEDYVRLHKMISNLSERKVWEALKNVETDYYELIEHLPDEFFSWVKEVSNKFNEQATAIQDEASWQYMTIRLNLKDKFDDRKAFAELAKKSKYPNLMFLKYDGKSLSDVIWKMIEPKGLSTPFARDTETE